MNPDRLIFLLWVYAYYYLQGCEYVNPELLYINFYHKNYSGQWFGESHVLLLCHWN